MTQRVLICNFQYYIVTPKKESYRLSHRKCRTFYEKLSEFLFFSLLVAYGISTL